MSLKLRTAKLLSTIVELDKDRHSEASYFTLSATRILCLPVIWRPDKS